jgi:hypothetical protein
MDCCVYIYGIENINIKAGWPDASLLVIGVINSSIYNSAFEA